jgi:hypothetical protein
MDALGPIHIWEVPASVDWLSLALLLCDLSLSSMEAQGVLFIDVLR